MTDAAHAALIVASNALHAASERPLSVEMIATCREHIRQATAALEVFASQE